MLGCIGSGAKLCFASVLTLKIKNHASSHVIKINTMEIGNLLSGEGNGNEYCLMIASLAFLLEAGL